MADVGPSVGVVPSLGKQPGGPDMSVHCAGAWQAGPAQAEDSGGSGSGSGLLRCVQLCWGVAEIALLRATVLKASAWIDRGQHMSQSSRCEHMSGSSSGLLHCVHLLGSHKDSTPEDQGPQGLSMSGTVRRGFLCRVQKLSSRDSYRPCSAPFGCAATEMVKGLACVS